MTVDPPDFAARYGPWALIAGASDGVGAAYASAVAERGVNVILLSRRQQVLDELAADIRGRWSVAARAVAVDLSEDSAADQIVEATDGLEIGTLMYCAGADPDFGTFLDLPIAAGEALVRRNCMTPLRLCHRFAAPMVERGHGALILVSSGAALAGSQRMVAYGATKAFDLLMAEGLWAELHGTGVDVLAPVLALTDTPALRRLLHQRGNLASADDDTPIPGAVTADEVVDDVLANLGNGPVSFVGDMMKEGAKYLGASTRNDNVRLMVEIGAGPMDVKVS